MTTYDQIKLHFNGNVKKVGNCFVWQGYTQSDGYGQLGKRLVHRIVYEKTKGKLVKGLDIDHVCRNRLCINPDHLEQVTHLQNMLRARDSFGLHNRIKTHCKNGHEYTEENTRYYSRKRNVFGRNKHRQCIACNKVATLKYYNKNRRKATT